MSRPANVARTAGSEMVERRILLVRGLDSDLADLYGGSTKRLNQQVRRNAARFPGVATPRWRSPSSVGMASRLPMQRVWIRRLQMLVRRAVVDEILARPSTNNAPSFWLSQSNDVPSLRDEPEGVRGQPLDALV